MLCLGIETSCDETALALVRDRKCVESVLATQMDVHALFGVVRRSRPVSTTVFGRTV